MIRLGIQNRPVSGGGKNQGMKRRALTGPLLNSGEVPVLVYSSL